MPHDGKISLTGIRAKLALLLGGSLAAAGANAIVAPAQQTFVPSPVNQLVKLKSAKPLAAKLILKQQKNGFKMIAQHGSHASHVSHTSHSSHTSSSY